MWPRSGGRSKVREKRRRAAAARGRGPGTREGVRGEATSWRDQADGARSARWVDGGEERGLGPAGGASPGVAGAEEQWGSLRGEEAALPGAGGLYRRRGRGGERRRGMGWLLVGSTSLVLVAALAGVVAAVVLLPAATVRLVPLTAQRTLVLTYGVRPGEGIDWVGPSRVVEVVVEGAVEGPASGSRVVPVGVARGVVRVVNPTLQAVDLPAGTLFVAASGQRYRLMADVTVPAADPFGRQAFGVADLLVEALAAGPEGNAEVGVVSGELESGLLYRNLEPISGGSLRSLRVVTEEDHVRLRAALEEALRRQVWGELEGALAEGERLVAGSLEVDAPEVEFSDPVGAESDWLVVRGRMRVRALAFSAARVHEAAQGEVLRRLSELTGPGEVLVGQSLVVSEPEVLGEDRWRVRAVGWVRLVPAEGEVEEVRKELAGKGVGEAMERLRGIGGVGAVEIELRPWWWRERLPLRAERIEVVVW